MWVTPPPDFVPLDALSQNSWILGKQLAGVTFRMQEQVDVIAGVGVGECGELISLYSVDPEPLYHVETSENKDLYARQSELIRRTP